MKKVISILILLVLLFLFFEWGTIYFKKGHEVSYQVYKEDKVFNIDEVYHKEYGDSYDILINSDGGSYSYIISNHYNKQKKIIKEINYYSLDNGSCIYPVLENGEGTYIECNQNGIIYTDTSFPNQSFITDIKNDLMEKGYQFANDIDTSNTFVVESSTVYSNSLLESDIITLWNYKGIELIKINNSLNKTVLNFDKYENNQSSLVGKYYIVPDYLSSKVLEFSSLIVVDVDSQKAENIDLGYTLSSSTYINGIIDNKLYYTDPTNLLQIEVNPYKMSSRLIGSKDIGGQLYQGKWTNVNIYDFVSKELLYKEEVSSEVDKYSYVDIKETSTSYYFYNSNGEVYRLSKNNLDYPVLLFQKQNLSNFKVIDNTIYFVVSDTLYYYEEGNIITPVLKNNELKFNTTNRVDVYRKS